MPSIGRALRLSSAAKGWSSVLLYWRTIPNQWTKWTYRTQSTRASHSYQALLTDTGREAWRGSFLEATGAAGFSLSGCDALPGAQKWTKESGIRGRPEDAWSRPVALATALEEAKDPV